MSKYVTLENAIRKCATGPDDTSYLLKALDECLSEELEASDNLLLSEIDDLELQNLKLRHELDNASQQIIQNTIKENQLKSAFKMEE